MADIKPRRQRRENVMSYATLLGIVCALVGVFGDRVFFVGAFMAAVVLAYAYLLDPEDA